MLDPTIVPGGPPARFEVTLADPASASPRPLLRLSTALDGLQGPPALRLEEIAGGRWQRIGTNVVDPEEPEELAVALPRPELPAGERRTFTFRVALPESYAPLEPTGTFTVGVGWSTQGKPATFRVGPARAAAIRIGAPKSIAPGGPPATVTVRVDNRTGHAHPRARVLLELHAVNLTSSGDVSVELQRGGRWVPVPANGIARGVPLVPELALSPGDDLTYVLRVRLPRTLGGGNVAARLTPRVRLVDTAAPADADLLATGFAELDLKTPTVTLPPPPVTGAPEGVVPLVIDNRSGVDYPPLHVDLYVSGPQDASTLGLSYRPAGTSSWTNVTFSTTPNGHRTRIPASGGVGAPDGFHAAYDVRLTSSTGTSLFVVSELMASGMARAVYTR